MKKRSMLSKMSNRHAIIFMALFVLLGIGLLILPRVFANHEVASELYSRRIFPVLAFLPSFVTNIFPISLTELFVVSFVFLFFVIIIALSIRIIQSDHRQRTFRNVFLVLSALFFIMSYQYSMMHGMNYSRQPIRQTLKLDTGVVYDAERIEEAMNFYLEGIISAQAELNHNEKGETMLISSISTTLRDGNNSMDNAAQVHSVFSGNTVVPKPVSLSKYWSYTHIVGMYNPFFVEANININTPEYEIPLTVCHEIAHVRGIAREDEANITSFIACLYSDRADYRYAASLYAFENLMCDMRHFDSEKCDALIARLPDAVFADWNASSEYWSQYEGKVGEISNVANDTFLKANLQEDGVQSYILTGQEFLDYYYIYLADQA